MTKRLISTIITLIMLILISFIISLPIQAATTTTTSTIKIGDYVQMGKYYDEPILWRCVDIDENGPLMLSDKILSLKPFDAAGEHKYLDGTLQVDSNNNRKQLGSNLWETSSIRSWLNSTASAGNVTWLDGCPPTEANVSQGYNEYANEKGFLVNDNFSASERNVIKSINQKSILNYVDVTKLKIGGTETYKYNYIMGLTVTNALLNFDTSYYQNVSDSMFLLDIKQVNKIYQNRTILGSNYNIGKLTQKAVDHSEYTLNGIAANRVWQQWLRTSTGSSSTLYTVLRINDNGTVGDCWANANSLGVRPAFYLDLSSSILTNGDGSIGNPYGVSSGIEKFSYVPNSYNKILALRAARYSMLAYDDYSYEGDNYWTRASRGPLNGGNGLNCVNCLYNPTELRRKLQEDGFSDENTFAYNYGDTDDTNVSFVLANKDVDYNGVTRKLVTVIIRGTDGVEWKGDMDATGNHYDSTQIKHWSFDSAKALVGYQLLQYLSQNNIESPLLLITGHSRGAATANLLAEDINERKSNLAGLEDSEVFAYTFATPNLTDISRDENSGNSNIFNFCFDDDFVPQVPLKGWKYDKYGQTFTAVAGDFYDTNVPYQEEMNNYIRESVGRTKPTFESAEAQGLIEYVEGKWKSVDDYYNMQPKINISHPMNNITLYDFFRNYVAPAAMEVDYGPLISKSLDSTYGRIVDFFFYGGVIKHNISDTHQMFTYYWALKNDGFDLSHVKYYLHVASDNGTVLRELDKSSYNIGDIVKLTASPAPGYCFLEWKGDASGNSISMDVTMNGDRYITANYENIDYNVNFTSEGGDIYRVTSMDPFTHEILESEKLPSSIISHYDDYVVLNAVPNEGYVFNGWTGDIQSNDPLVSIIVKDNLNIIANYKRAEVPATYNISGYVTDSVSGLGLPNVSVLLNASSGQPWTKTTGSNGYYEFVGAVSSTHEISVVLPGYMAYQDTVTVNNGDAEKNISLVPIASSYTVSMGSLTGGSISANPALATAGITINLTITPDTGMRLKAGTLKYNDGTNHVISGTSFTMPAANVTVTAVLEAIPVSNYTVSTGILAGGSITASPTSASSGDTISLTITPDTGKQLKTGTLKYNDGLTNHLVIGTSFSMPTTNVTVSAEFEAAPHVIIDTGGTNGQAQLPVGTTNLLLGENSVLELGNGLQTAADGNITIGGQSQSMNSFTGGSLNNVNLTAPQYVGGQAVQVEKAVRLESGTDNQPITITNSGLSGVSASIPDGTTIMAPAGWNGSLTPPRQVASAGTAPSGFSVGGTVIEVGAPNAILLFDKPVTLTLQGVTGAVAYKPSGSNTWVQITQQAGGTYANPTPPTFPGEAYISNGTDTKIITYHMTAFAGLTVVPLPPYTPSWYSVSGVSLDKTTLSLSVGETPCTLTASIQPAYASNPMVNWSSSEPTVASVNGGVVTPLIPGKTTITVTTSDGEKTASCIVIVTPSPGGNTQWDERKAEQSVAKDKTWRVKFSNTVDPETINRQNIMVLDSKDEPVEIEVKVDAENDKIILVTPKVQYNKGEQYRLFLGVGLDSSTGKSLSKGILYRFTVE